MKYLNVARLAAVLGLTAGCTPGWIGAPAGPAPMGRTIPPDLRVVQSASRTSVSFAELVDRAALADVVFFGEQHDDPETHFAEFALLEGIGRRRSRVVLSLEMFERDVQKPLNDYLAGRISEADFLANGRPWERYVTDYRPLVLLARARGWRVVAADIPRPIASAVSRQGLGVIDTLSPASRAWAAREFLCPHDAYYTRFAEEMTGHSAGGGPPTAADAAQMLAMTNRFYEAQCTKDETMAESIASAVASEGPDAIVVHLTGAFHSDYRQGTVQRTLRRRPDLRSLVITAVPSDDPATATIDDVLPRADYVIVTRKSNGASQK